MPRVLVFDFGNVLLRWDPHAILQRAGAIETGAETSERIARAFASALWTDFDRGLAPADEVVAGLERRTSLPEVVCRQFIEHAPDWLEPITPSVRLLEELFDARDQGAMDARIAFLSNMPAPWAAVLRDRHAWIARFDCGVFSGEVGHVKPEPAIYRRLESAVRSRRSADQDGIGVATGCDIHLLDDTPGHVEAARRLGWSGACVTGPDALAAAVTAWRRSQ